jgi:hypothetical protein
MGLLVVVVCPLGFAYNIKQILVFPWKKVKRARWDALNYLSESFILTTNDWPLGFEPRISGDVTRISLF